jgi:hypothetical protein
MPLSHFTRAISCVIFYTTTKLSFVLTFPNWKFRCRKDLSPNKENWFLLPFDSVKTGIT